MKTGTVIKYVGLTLSLIAIMAPLPLAGCSGNAALENQINRIVEPFHFSILGWQIEALSSQFDDYIFGKGGDGSEKTEIVKEYFENQGQIASLEQKLLMVKDGLLQASVGQIAEQIQELSERNSCILSTVEATLSSQINTVLKETGIINPWQDLHTAQLVFPPVNFVIEPPPHLLVVSPRDEITRIKDITLDQQITEEQKEVIEEEISELGMSALVVRLGGIATYPAFLSDTMSLEYSKEVAVEEWFHQYLFFRPLGFRYGLHVAGLTRDYEIATVNEALAGMVSAEIASLVYEKYYQEPQILSTGMPIAAAGEFDFYAEMRSIRIKVDELLQNGQVEEAERYMEEKRLQLASHGYYIRKLNQAYFAFYGTYASSPGSVSPIGSGLKALRQKSDSLKSFVEQISSMTDADEIIEASD
jgi:transposase-like protein